MASLLEVNHARQSFREGFWMKRLEVLHGVSLSVPQGSIFGFLGANGAGKTTLINLIVGLRRPTEGTVRIAGLDAWTVEARSKIGFLPERPYFHEHLTAEGLLRYFGALAGMSRSHVMARIPVVLGQVGMGAAKQVELKRYSKGMLQRIGIAQALLHDPELLVLDEPMSGLDPLGRKEMRELILALAAEGRTVFFSTHVIPDVESICDQVALIQKGKLIGSGPIESLLARRSSQTEIGFAGLDLERAKSELSASEKLRVIPEGLSAVFSGQEALDHALGKVLALRGHILWVNPVRQSLESLFEDDTRGYHEGT